MLILALTLSQAASILGIEASASKAEINAAYRNAVSKYHPDANRNKTPDEQKEAEKMFKQVGMARKVMLNPDLADPEPSNLSMTSSSAAGRTSAASTRTTTSSAPRQTTQRGTPRATQSYQASASSSQYVPQGYNTAHSFHDNVEKVVDPAEEELARIYREETRKEYLTFSDKARLTPSFGTSAILLVFAIAMFFMAPFSLSAISLANPSILLAIISIVKMFTYDLFASYYVHKAIAKKIKRAWGMLFGTEISVLGIVGLVVFATHSETVVPLGIPVAIGLIALGILTSVISLALSKKKSEK